MRISIWITIILIFCISSSSLSSDELIISNLNKENYVVETLTLSRQYIDRRYRIMKFPSFLSGAIIIKTANDDKLSNNKEFLKFSVNKKVSVFLAHDKNIKNTPIWLMTNFIKTNLIISNGDVDYVLYKKDFPIGNVSLGGNVINDNEDAGMYSVIVAEQTTIPEQIEYINDDYISLLKKYSKYNSKGVNIPAFTYQNKNDSILQRILSELTFDQIINQEDEVTQIIELMKWVNRRIEHDGSNSIKNTETLNIIDYYDRTGRGLNCRAVSIVLNDLYLAFGYQARIVSCLPHEDYDTESHVTNLVYSKSLNKWLYMDASFSAYVTDLKGNILNHFEIRDALTDNKQLIVKGGLLHNGNPYGGGQDEYIKKYMAKNLFRFSSPVISKYGYEYSDDEKNFVVLNPDGYRNDLVGGGMIQSGLNHNTFYTQNAKLFWQYPKK